MPDPRTLSQERGLTGLGDDGPDISDIDILDRGNIGRMPRRAMLAFQASVTSSAVGFRAPANGRTTKTMNTSTRSAETTMTIRGQWTRARCHTLPR
jgi:hypothetical protein